ncbi:MAG: DHH family phosphoesterase, partial [Gemmatimonadales bacterium]
MPTPKARKVADAQQGAIECGEPRLAELHDALKGGEHLLILTHDNPDPDALASAFALLALAQTLDGLTARIGFGGFVGRAENRTMVRELDLPVMPAWALNLDDADLVALVDTQPGTGNNSLPDGCDVAAVVDHHPLREETKQARFWDVRTGCGSSST